MIELYSGTPGSGKSYHATERIYYYLGFGNVIANYEIELPEKPKYIEKMSRFHYVDNSRLTVDYLKAFARKNHKPGKERQTLIVIDEAGVKFNARDWRDKDRLSWLDFFSQHRKFGYEIIMIAQADIMIDKQIRQFIENEVMHRNFFYCGFVGKVLYPIYHFVAITRWYGNKMILRREFLRWRGKIAKMYNTFGKFNGFDESGDDSEPVRR